MSKNISKTIKQKYRTRDLYEAAALSASGESLVGIEKEEKICYFIFSDAEACRQKVTAYTNNQLAVLARSYAEAVKTLKSRIYE
jgi:hypothetical protein